MLFLNFGISAFNYFAVFRFVLTHRQQPLTCIEGRRVPFDLLCFFGLLMFHCHIFDLIFQTLQIVLLLDYQSVVFGYFGRLEMYVV